jgi:hypothetical protein
MTWFKVDDNYWSHPKVMFQPLQASGLWVRAGSWTANHLTDGRIPIEITHTIAPRIKPRTLDALGDQLEAHGMWYRENGDWVFHDWAHYQPTRAKIEAERERNRKRLESWRARNRDL